MEFKDEEILLARKAEAKKQMEKYSAMQQERELKESIFDGLIHIQDKEVMFARRSVDELLLSVYMPKTFERMDDETRKIIYPIGNAPSHVFYDYKIPFQMTLNRSGHIVPDDGIAKLMQMTGKLMENYGPKVRILSSGVVRQNEHNTGIMEFSSRSVTGNVYNVMFFISIREHVVIGNIHFPSQYSKRLMPVAKEIIDSIEIIQEDNNGDNNISES